MTRPQKRDSLAGYALAAAIGIAALIVVSLLGMSQADAGGYRQRAVCNVAHQQAIPVAAPAYYPVIGFQASQYLQQRAVDTYGFRQSDEYAEYLQLLGERRGTDKVLAALGQRLTNSGDRPVGPHQPPSEGHDATDGGQTTEEPQAFSAPAQLPGGWKQEEPGVYVKPLAPELPSPPAAPVENEVATGFAATFPRWQAVCAGCHSGPEPKGDVDIANAVHQAFAEDSCEAREHFARLVADGEMPKGKPLDDAAKGALLLELYRSK